MKKSIHYILSIVMILSLISSSAFAQAGLSNFNKIQTYKSGQYSDVGANDWFSSNVKAAYENGLMLGVSSNNFGASSNVKLSEVIAMAARLNSIYNTGSANFPTSSPWYQSFVDYAIEKGIINKGRFENLGADATRYQVAEIFSAALPASALPTINNITVGQIPDVSLETPYQCVYNLYWAGVLTGKSAAGNFVPSENVLRSEIVAIVTRMADPNLRVKFTIDKSTAGNVEITSGTKLLDTVNGSRYYVLLALDCYNLACQAISSNKAIVIDALDSAEVKAQKAALKSQYLLAATNSLSKADEYTTFAASSAQNAATYCKSNSKYSQAYDNTYNSYLACLQADKYIVAVAAAPTADGIDLLSAKSILSDCGESLSKAYNTIGAIK